MANLEWTAVKTTVDKLAHDLRVDLPGVAIGQVDDSANFESILSNAPPAILYQISKLSGRAPKFSVTFLIGAKTTDDGNNFELTKMVDAMNDKFFSGARFDLHDYSGDTASGRLGAMMLTDVDVLPQQFDKQSGIRMLSCSAKVLCRGS